MEDPFHHFELHPIFPIHLFGIDLSINKAVLMMWIVVGVVFGFFYLAGRNARLVPTGLQGMAEAVIEVISNLIRENAGEEGMKYFPFLATVFLFVLSCNWIGLVPGAYTSTSQIFVTGALAIIVYLASLVVGFRHHGIRYLKIYVPPGVPWLLAPFMVPIEIVSQLARPFSLSIRLFANMTAGHVVLGIFLGFVVALKFYLAWIPLGMSVALLGLELFIGIIQAYIFTLLASVYIGESIHGH